MFDSFQNDFLVSDFLDSEMLQIAGTKPQNLLTSDAVVQEGLDVWDDGGVQTWGNPKK